MKKTIGTAYIIGLATVASHLYAKKVERELEQATEQLYKQAHQSALDIANLGK